jgi:hypothetical protein
MKKKFEACKAKENGTKPFKSLTETVNQQPVSDKTKSKKRFKKLANYMSRDGSYDWTESGSENPE